MTKPRQQLEAAVLRHSIANTWEQARQEWDVIGLQDATGECVCTQDNLRWLYTISNRHNGNTLHPIGSDCIDHFRQESMTVKAKTLADYQALCAIHRARGITLSDLKPNRLRSLWRMNCLPKTRWNHGDVVTDYKFLMDMARRRKSMTPKQEVKVDILLRSVAKFLER